MAVRPPLVAKVRTAENTQSKKRIIVRILARIYGGGNIAILRQKKRDVCKRDVNDNTFVQEMKTLIKMLEVIARIKPITMQMRKICEIDTWLK